MKDQKSKFCNWLHHEILPAFWRQRWRQKNCARQNEAVQSITAWHLVNFLTLIATCTQLNSFKQRSSNQRKAYWDFHNLRMWFKNQEYDSFVIRSIGFRQLKFFPLLFEHFIEGIKAEVGCYCRCEVLQLFDARHGVKKRCQTWHRLVSARITWSGIAFLRHIKMFGVKTWKTLCTQSIAQSISANEPSLLMFC